MTVRDDGKSDRPPPSWLGCPRSLHGLRMVPMTTPLDVHCDACGAEAGEPCRPDCIGQAAHQDELDTCDRCGTPAERIHVGHEAEKGYDGLCDACLDSFYAGKWTIETDRFLAGCSCTRDPDTGDLYDDDGFPCAHGA